LNIIEYRSLDTVSDSRAIKNRLESAPSSNRKFGFTFKFMPMKCPRKLVTFLVVASMSSALAEEIVTELQLPAVDAKNDEPSSSELVPSQGDSDPSTDTLEELKERLRHLENVAFANKQQDPPPSTEEESSLLVRSLKKSSLIE